LIKKQIADDRAAREAKLKPTTSEGAAAKRTAISSIAGTHSATSSSCLIQVRNVQSFLIEHSLV